MTTLSKYSTFHTKYGIVTLYNNEVGIGGVFKSGHYWEEGQLLQVSQYIDPNRHILEIGGHCGTSSIFYAKYLNNDKKLFVYEPQKNMHQLLLLNIHQNSLQDKIIPHNLGVFCYMGIGVMNNIDLDGGGGEVSKRYNEEINLGCNFGGIGLGMNGERVNLTTIDDMNLEDIGFIHCDAQGAENFIFSKGIATITRCRPVILYENKDFCGTYLFENICSNYPHCIEESKFDIKKFCMETLKYTHYIDRINGGDDTLLIP